MGGGGGWWVSVQGVRLGECSQGGVCPGGCLPRWGVCLGGGCLPRGCLPRGCGCLPRGVST